MLETYLITADSINAGLIICGYGGVFESAVWKAESIKFAVTKCVTPEWHQIFLKAIGGANPLAIRADHPG